MSSVIKSSVATGLQSLPGVQAGYGSELPSVVSGPTIGGGGGDEAAVSSAEASSSSSSGALSSGAGRLRWMRGLSWMGVAVLLFAYVW